MPSSPSSVSAQAIEHQKPRLRFLGTTPAHPSGFSSQRGRGARLPSAPPPRCNDFWALYKVDSKGAAQAQAGVWAAQRGAEEAERRVGGRSSFPRLFQPRSGHYSCGNALKTICGWSRAKCPELLCPRASQRPILMGTKIPRCCTKHRLMLPFSLN